MLSIEVLYSSARFELSENKALVMIGCLILLGVGSWFNVLLPCGSIGMRNNLIVMNDQIQQNKVTVLDVEKWRAWFLDSKQFAEEFKKSFDRTEYGALYNTLTKDGDNKFPIFVDISNKFFWTHNVNYEFASPLYIPAVVGVPLILGLPPAGLEKSFSRRKTWWYSEKSRASDISDDALMRYAKDKNFHSVYRFYGNLDAQKNGIRSVN